MSTQPPIFAYIHKGDMRGLREFCSSLSPEQLEEAVNTKHNDSFALTEACRQRLPEMVEFLLKDCRAKVNQYTSWHQTALLVAVGLEEVRMAEILLDHKADVNLLDIPPEADYTRCFPLSRACRTGNVQMIKMLLSRGANINNTDFRGDNCLFDAVRSQSADVVNLVLKEGVSTRVANLYGETALKLARKYAPEMAAILEKRSSYVMDQFEREEEEMRSDSFSSYSESRGQSPEQTNGMHFVGNVGPKNLSGGSRPGAFLNPRVDLSLCDSASDGLELGHGLDGERDRDRDRDNRKKVR